MSNDANGSGGSNSPAGGDAEPNKQKIEPKKEDTVSYETYQKVLDEKKARDAELKKYRDEENKRKEEELKSKENWKALVDDRDKKLQDAESKLTKYQEVFENSAKLSAVLDCLPGRVPEQYHKLFELSKVAIDPESGLPDKVSAQRYAQEFCEEFKDIVRKSPDARMPNDAAKGAKKPISLEEWQALPLKEKKERYSEVFTAYNKK